MEYENLVVEETNENVETQTTEENVEGIELTDTTEANNAEEKEEVKTYTQEEVESIIQTRLARQKDKLERRFNKDIAKYKRTEEILNAGLGTDNIEDANEKMVTFYENSGVTIPKSSNNQGLTQKQVEILAVAEANDIIQAGEEREELDRLLQIDVKDMTPVEKIIYKKLYEKISYDDKKQELASKGEDLSILDSKEFQMFEKQFNKETKLSDVVDLFKLKNPTEQPKKMGSMKSSGTTNQKEFYTPEEVQNLSPEDWEKPGVWEKVLASQTKWKK